MYGCHMTGTMNVKTREYKHKEFIRVDLCPVIKEAIVHHWLVSYHDKVRFLFLLSCCGIGVV